MVDTLSLVVLMSRATPEEIAAATARRTEIINHLLEFLTGDAFSTKELQHFRFVGDIFSISAVIKELCANSSTTEARTELALAAAMCALNIAIDDSPPPPSQRILDRREERRESRAAAKEFEQRVAGLKPDGVAKSAGKPEPSAQEHLDLIRKRNRDRQRERRARLKAKKTAVG
jgi:hypothetical protein